MLCLFTKNFIRFIIFIVFMCGHKIEYFGGKIK